MATDKQIEANRKNAASSTGPRTPQGKAVSSQNGLRHGLYAAEFPIGIESRESYDELANSLIAHYRPTHPGELALVQTMIAARWKILRLWGMQTGVLNEEVESQTAKDPDLTDKRPSLRAGLAFSQLAAKDGGFRWMHHVEETAERAYHRALRRLLFDRREAEKAKVEDQTQFDRKHNLS